MALPLDGLYYWNIDGEWVAESGGRATLVLIACGGHHVDYILDGHCKNDPTNPTKIDYPPANIDPNTISYEIKPAIPDPGYVFDRWVYEAPEGRTFLNSDDVKELPLYEDFGPLDPPNKTFQNYTLKAITHPITYTLKFDPNGGTGTMVDLPMTYDQEKKLPANTFKNSDIKFLGWNTKADGSGTAYNDEDTVKNLAETQDATATLYAQWEKPEDPEKKDPEKKDTQGDGDLYVPFDETGKLFQVAIVKRTDTTLKLSWNKVPGADRYVIYGRPCFHFPLLKIAEIKDPDTLTYVQTGLIKDKYYKYQLKAYKGKKCLAKTLIVHGTTMSDKNTVAGKIEITNVVGGTMEKTSASGKTASLYSASANGVSANSIEMGTVRLKKKEKIKITAKEVPEESGKTIDRHRPRHNGKEKRQIEYQSTDKKVAKVTKTGLIKARNTGECVVFANAQNGVLYRIRVIVE